MKPAVTGLLLVLIAAACSGPSLRVEDRTLLGTWNSTVLLDVGEEVGIAGVAIGDFDASSPGLEVAALAGEGGVHIIARAEGRWTSRLAYQGPGELIQGRAYPVDDGPAGIAAVGMVKGPESDTGGPGRAVLLMPAEDGHGLREVRLWTPSRCVHGVAVADVNADSPGAEVVAADFGGTVALCSPTGDSADVIFKGSSRAKALVAADLSSVFEGLEVVCAFAGGEVVLLGRTVEGWEGEVLVRREAGAARLAARADLGESEGPDLVCGFDDGAVLAFHRSGDAWTAEEVLRCPNKIRGVALGDLLPGRSGLEVAAAAKDGTVRIATEGEIGGHTIHRGDHPLHDLSVGDLLPETDGDELVTGGYGGKVVLLHRDGGSKDGD